MSLRSLIRKVRLGNIKKSISFFISPDIANMNAKISYSQCGEDLIIDYVFKLRGIKKPTYIDIGAHHPFHLNNTALFYQRGCTGINIDANPQLLSEFEINRRRDINLNVGVGAQPGEFDFFIMEDKTLSTFSKHEVDAMISYGKLLAEVRKVRIITVKEIIERYFQGNFPDFMSLDVEGMDMEILKSIDFEKSSPKVICVEAAEYSPKGAGARREELIDFLAGKNYYEYANTNLNAIMVKRDFWFS